MLKPIDSVRTINSTEQKSPVKNESDLKNEIIEMAKTCPCKPPKVNPTLLHSKDKPQKETGPMGSANPHIKQRSQSSGEKILSVISYPLRLINQMKSRFNSSKTESNEPLGLPKPPEEKTTQIVKQLTIHEKLESGKNILNNRMNVIKNSPNGNLNNNLEELQKEMTDFGRVFFKGIPKNERGNAAEQLVDVILELHSQLIET